MNKSTFLKLLLVLATVIGIARISLPFMVSYYMTSTYAQLSHQQKIEIGEIELSLLRGQMTINNMVIEGNGAPQKIDRMDLNIGVLGLFQNKIIIEALTINGVFLELTQNESELRLAGIQIPFQSDEEVNQSAPSEVLRPWSFQLEHIRLNDVNFKLKRFNDHMDFTVDALEIKQLNDQHIQLETKISLNQLELPNQGIKLQESMTLLAGGEITALFSQPTWQGNIAVRNGHLQVPIVGAFHFEEMKLNKALINQHEQKIQLLELNKVMMHQDAIKFTQFTTEDISFKSNQLYIGKQVITELESSLKVSKDGGLENITLNNNKDNLHEANKRANTQNNDSALGFKLSTIEIEDESKIIIINEHLTDPLNVTFTVESLAINNVNNLGEDLTMNLTGKFDKFSRLTLALKTNLKNENTHLNIGLSQFNLVPLNGYIEQSIGYHVEQGLADFNLALEIKQDNLMGKAEIKITDSELEPSDKDTIDRISKKISMPISTALSLIKDDNNNIQLDVPITGNIQDPEFGLESLLTILTTKALKSASVNYLLQAFFPYNYVLSAAQYVGGEIFAIRLDSIIFQDENLTPQQIVYLEKIASIMMDKESLQLKVCPFQEKNQKNENWQKIAMKKSEYIKQSLVKMNTGLSSRVTLCKPKLAEKTEVVIGF